ncbi:MAG TPA: RQC domain-containing protein, partial [Planctomycetota bacterium]|nr:RQC domain-containing protein [Planctomycetota bacterium]
RDGKPADCVLFHSGQDYQLWRMIIEKNETTDLDAKMKMLSEMYDFATSARCRHRRLVEYFGQAWTKGACGACDVCTGTLPALPESSDLARRILAGVVRTGQRYGLAYVIEVLAGESTERVVQRGHESLEVFGSMRDQPKQALFTWMRQLIDQDAVRPEGEYGVLKMTPRGLEVFEGKAEIPLYGAPTAKKKKRRSTPSPIAKPESGVGTPLDADARDLFDRLRALRREIADERGLPAFMVFSDRTLRDMARRRPTTKSAMLEVVGVGPAKLESFGERFLRELKT